MAAAYRSLLDSASSGDRVCTAHDGGSGTDVDKPEGSERTVDRCVRSFRTGTNCATEVSSEQMYDGHTRQWSVEHVGGKKREEADGISQKKENVLKLLSSVLHGGKGLHVERLEVSDSRAVTVGNVTYVLGNVNVEEVVQENHLKHQEFVSHTERGSPPDQQLRVVSRAEWLALPPTQPPCRVDGPLSLVIINHTGFRSSTTPAVNMALVRQMQLMHMRDRGWLDIAYNFLVGMDGLVYEGRGWGAVGSHNKGFNWASVGVAFIGCFTLQPPSPQAVRSLRLLLEEGVRRGRLSADHRLVASCQCRPTLSPGHAFCSLIRTWPPAGPPAAPTTVGSQQTSEQPVVSTISAPDGVDDRTPAVDDSSAPDNALSRQSPEAAGGTQRVTCSLSEGSQAEDAVEKTEDAVASNPATVSCREDTYVCDETSDHQVSVEEWRQEKKAVQVSRSRNVRLGGVTYVVGPLDITQTVQTFSGEKHLYASRGSPDRVAAAVSERPHLKLVSREHWSAAPAVAPVPNLPRPVRTVVICQTGTKEPTSTEGECRQVRSLQDFEVQCRGRADLPFNFVVAPSGSVYEGRGWELVADIGPGVSTAEDGHCLAVALMGAFRKHLPTSAALLTLNTLLQVAQDQGVLVQDYCLVGHCQLAATGKALLSLLKKCQHWTN